MTITYRTEGDWGAGKGANLTPGEVDANFYSLAQEIDALSDTLVPAGIESVELIGSQLKFTLADATELGPVTVPTALPKFAGEWTASTAYVSLDILDTFEGPVLVLQAHTSEATFDLSRQIGGQPVYQLLSRDQRSKVFNISASTFAPGFEHIWAYVRISEECTVTLPSNANVPLPIGTEIHLRQAGIDAITINGQSGVTVIQPDGMLARTDRTGAVVTAKKVAANIWDLFGLLEIA